MRLNQVTLAVSDLDRSVAFYRGLGLKQIVADDRYARFVCPDGGSTLSLDQSQMVPPSATTVYLASSADVERVTGKYFSKCHPVRSNAVSQDVASQRKLWALSEEMMRRGRAAECA